MVYKKIAIVYVFLVSLIFTLSFIRANKSTTQSTQLSLSQSPFLIIGITSAILVAIFIAFRFFGKKKEVSPLNAKL